MSGQKNHYIPQFLLRGFVEQRDGKPTTLLNAFSRKNGPLTVNIRDFAAERRFYSDDKSIRESSLDDEITRYEADHAHKILLDAKRLPTGSNAPPQRVAELIVHLAIRAAFLRSTITSAMTAITGKLQSMMDDKDKVRKIMIGEGDKKSSYLVAAIKEEYKKNEMILMLRGIDLHSFTRMVYQSTHMHGDAMIESAMQLSPMIFGQMEKKSPEIMRRGHVNALRKSLAPRQRIVQLLDFKFKVISAPEFGIILPDCVVSATRHDSSVTPYVLESIKNINSIILPLSSSKILYGYRKNEKIDLLNLNRKLARCCFEFYVGSRDQTSNSLLQAEVGKHHSEIVKEAAKEDVDPA